MKIFINSIAASFLLLFSFNTVDAQTTLAQESFESPSGDFGFIANAAGSCSDFFQRVTSNPTCFGNNIDGSADGNAWWGSEDIATAVGGDGLITLNPISVTGYSNLQVTIAIADARGGDAFRWESSDRIWVEFSMDGGGWTPIGLFRGAKPATDLIVGTDLTLDSDNNPNTPAASDLVGPTVTQTFTDYAFLVGLTGNSLQVRLRCTQTGGTEELGLDNIRVTGDLSTNMAPVLANIEGSAISYSEGDPATQITNALTVSDSDDTDLEGATVSIISGFDDTEDELLFTNQNGISGSYSAVTGILTLTGTSSVANYQTALRSVDYRNNDAADASNATRTIRFRVNDGTDNSNMQDRDINVSTSLNTTPITLPFCESFETNGEGTRYGSNNFTVGCTFAERGAVGSDPCYFETITMGDGSFSFNTESTNSNGGFTLTSQDIDITGLNDMTLEILLGISRDGEARWENTDQVRIEYNVDGGPYTIIGLFTGNNPNPILGGEMAEDTDQIPGTFGPFGTLLTDQFANFTYNFNVTGSVMTYRIVVLSTGTEELSFDYICVSGLPGQAPPVLSAIEGSSIMYTEGDPATQISNTITVSDPDDTEMESATVTICDNFEMGEDVLAFTPFGGITGMYDAMTGILSLSGTASLADYQSTLRSVTYENTNATNPSSGVREVCFQVNDGDANSNIESRMIEIEDLLDPPVCLPWTESFEDPDGEGTRYNSNSFDDNPSCDFFIRTNSQPACHADLIAGVDGSFYWASEDVKGGSNGSVPAIVELQPADVMGYTALQVEIALGVSNSNGSRFELNDALLVQFDIDGGGWTTIGAFYGDDAFGGDMRQDANLDGMADPAGTVLTSTLQNFTFPISATGNVLKVRVVIDQAGGSEEIVFDNIRVTGTPGMATTFTALADLCEDAGIQMGLGGGMPTGGEYSGPGVTDNMNDTYDFDPSDAGVGVHVITYTVGSGCSGTAMDDVEVFALDDASYSYGAGAYCVNDVDPTPTITGLGGGTFSSSPAGLILDAGTGTIDVSTSTPNTYVVTYTTNGICPNTSDVMVIINALDDASFSYSASAYCVDDADPTPTITGMGGGTFSSIPAGLSLNTGTGTIDVSTSTPNTYVVTYTTAGTCPNSSNFAVTISGLDDASFSYNAATYCVNDVDPTPTITGLGGGTFSSSPAGLSINTGTGEIDVSLSTPNTYTVTYTTAGTCPNASNVLVTINGLDDASFSYSAGAYCVDDVDPTPTITGLGGGTFSSIPAGLSINAGTGAIDVSLSTPNTYTVTYTTAGPCPNSSDVMVTISGLDDASFSYSAGAYCVNDADPTPTITGLGGGTFSSAPTGLSLNTGTGAIDVSISTPNTYTVIYTTSGTCPNSSNVAVTINAIPNVTFTTLMDLCIDAGIQMDLGGGTPVGGVYSGPGVIDGSDGMTYDFNPASAGSGIKTINYTFTDVNGCSDVASDNVEVFPLPSVMFTALDDLCEDAGIQMDLSGGSPSQGTEIGDMGVYMGMGVNDNMDGTYDFDPSIGPGMYTITYTYTDENGCSDSASDDVVVFPAATATFDIGKDFLCEDVGAGATLGGGMPTGGEYSGDGVTDDGNGTTFTYNPPGLGLQTITYTYTDGNGCEVSVDDVIEVFDCDPEITDPCSCLNNATVYDVDAMTGGEDGQFSERVSIVDGQMVGLPPGQTWTVTAASGAYDAFAPLPVPPAQTPLMANLVGETLLDDGMGGYYIDFYHVDDMPYSITIEGPFAQGDPANSVFTIGNHCKYPNPEFDPSVPDDICPTSPVFTFGAIDPDMIGADDVTYELSYEGGPFMMAMDFDPQTMMPGSYLVKMTYDGADDGNGGISPDPGTTPAYPGCIQMIQKTMELREPVNFMSCNDELQASLSEDCTVELIAEMFFEDELFRCYDDYIITVDGVEDPIIRETGEYSVGLYDPVTGNNCWSTVIVEDKLGPVFPMACMQDDPCAYPCYTPVEDIIANAEMIVQGVTDCSEYEIVGPSVVRHPSDDCMEADTLILTYTGIDAMGNQSTKSYYYALLPVNLVNLEFPGNWPGTCNSSRSPEVTGSPTVDGMDFTFDGSTTSQLCDILVGYTDLVIPTCESDCDGSVKIVRDWTVLNWCDSDYRTGTQIIHLKDNEDPTIDPFDPDVASVDPWTCQVERYLLPEMDADDNCTDSLDLKKTIVPPAGITIAQETDGNYYAYNVPKGTHYFEYYAEDCCGNVSLVQPFELNVVDEVAPIAIAKQFSVVSLSNDGLEAGLAKIYAESIDNGSYDRCTDVHLQIRRDGYYATDGSEEDDLDYLDPHKVEDTWDGVTYFNRSLEDNSICNIPVATYPCDHIGNDTYAYSADFFGGWNLPAGCNNDVDTDEGQYVKFCCDDLTAIVVDANNDGVMDQNDRGYHKVWLRVWDNADMSVDPDTGAPTYGTDGDYYNETWAYVKVEVSAPPILTVRDATINCDWPFEEKMEEGYFGSDCSTGELTYTDWMYEYLYWEGICDVQVCIDRWYYASNYDDVCRDGDIYIVYRAKNPDSKGLEVTRTQKITVTNLDRIVCGDIAWPRAFIETDCEGTQMQPDLEWEANACSLIGWTYRSDTFRFESDACVKIINEYTVIDWCLFEETHNVGQGFVDDWGDNNGDDDGWYFEGGHDYFDGLLCSDPYDINTGFWPYDGRQSENGVYKYVEIIKIDDDVPPEMEVQDTMYAITTIECERAIQLEATVTDASDESCPATWFKWEITFDWNRNGIFDDYTYTRDNELAPLRGDVLTFVPYQWWSTSLPRADYIFTGPMETYDVQYIVYDGCGNVDKEVRTVMIVDKKDPTPYCVSLSSAVMENGQVELWARDFDKGSFDNCYSDEELSFTFNEEQPVLSKIGQVHYFKGAGEDATVDEYNEGDAQKWDPAQNSSARIFDCDDVAASPIDVRMTVWDGKVLDGALINWDWCSVELTLIDNQGTCVQQRASISGEVATEQGNEVSEVSITLDNLSNPEFNLEVMTGNNGMYAFANNPLYVGYDISALKDGDDTEGVSTLDLVLIQRHILGIETFDSPYKMIAADINSDRKITGTDLVVLRKTILDLYHEFPTNTSWRFVEKNQGLTLDNALSQYNEVINISSLDGNLTEEDFVAVKIGDVNATARTNGRSLNQTRSAGTLTVGLEEQQVTEGQTVEVTFSSSDFKEVYGYQFTLELNGLTIESVQAGDAEMTAANIGVLDEHMVTVSYSDMDGLGASDQLFTLTAIATQSGQISEMIDLTSNVINSEGYVGAGLDIHTIELTINGSEEKAFRLDQNEPNPFDEVTIVGFELPESGNATLTVYDVAGKVVTSLRGTYAQGYNEIKLNKEDLNTTGVLYYTLKSGEFTATKKMIIIE